MAQVASNIASLIPGSTAVALDYPAAYLQYAMSVSQGIAAMTVAVADYATKCPGSQIGLLGYSQGGEVATDFVCGSSEVTTVATKGLVGLVGTAGMTSISGS
jgi:hypothetical protein